MPAEASLLASQTSPTNRRDGNNLKTSQNVVRIHPSTGLPKYTAEQSNNHQPQH